MSSELSRDVRLQVLARALLVLRCATRRCLSKDSMMLRITRQPGVEHDSLLLEGNLLKEWIQELQQALALARQAGAAVALDLSGLRFVDAEGTRCLRECRDHGVTLLGTSPFVRALLDSPPPRQ